MADDPNKPKSKTAQALLWLQQNPEETPYAAAKQAGISRSVVYRALQRNAGRPLCEHCGQPLPK